MDYDIPAAFKRIENELQASMMRNFEKHKAEEIAEGFEWEMWQSIQLRELKRYQKEMRERFTPEFLKINNMVRPFFRAAKNDAEKKLQKQLIKFTAEKNVDFLKINDQRLTAMIDATVADFAKAEWSMLRQANDQYRKVIFNAQMYSATGSTYEAAVDMAAKDFLQAGINCVVYRNGSHHTVEEYAEMALRTGQKRAYLMGEGAARDRYGIHTVRVNVRTHGCPKCVRWQGRILIDDVYSGGTNAEAEQLNVPLLSQAINEGFLHPNCRDVYSTYIPDVSAPENPRTAGETEEMIEDYNREQKIRHADNLAGQYDRMSRLCLSQDNRRVYAARAKTWRNYSDKLKGGNDDN